MEFNLELTDMQLIKEEFEVLTDTFSQSTKVKNKIESKVQIGFAVNSKKQDDIKLVAKYEINFNQIDDSEKIVTKDNVVYLFIFTDKDNVVIDKLNNEELNEDERKELGNLLNALTYPYIKEYLESKYKKANIEIKLPLTFNNDK